ncbi:peptidylprolyl isomerase [Neptunomonas phycophila]|jgi:FKBP-type peptidyl-prolyl cis-trans isomerase SlpA|uniref:Peptidyl-prolyl cis-trans isomerase n=1 Tax=Neptunomonas phycophila TaxID=1572645 RepID=A0AAW7XIR6_9GAMM|nr:MULTISPECIES: peptidylprolyl isomerase [Neptunomonas]MBT3145850.1 peptidylprolyl isomerase [Neptunomonas phycophila]MDN2659009.1 peptidylprolyl isomerase [Neptunomonas sp. CHC150]MDO6452964.1 peptidylprolyl isomerase [Neptunomonas phycophila]MDO6469674.1 peptidylprolyl isomerase [Neptunomonas phycophila]MDO6784602.1 peptidylprolyl isomerase [Neptunomonas phycophila]
MSQLVIGPETKVTLHFEIRLENGDVVDSNFDKQPASFSIGDGSMLAGFEAALFGLKVGERKVLAITPEHGFGMPNPSNLHKIERGNFADIDLEPGVVVSFQDPSGELPGVIRSFDDQFVEVDFNHPLAGKHLEFEVEIIDIAA